MNPRIKLAKEKSAWGNVSWTSYVDGVSVCTTRLRKDALRSAEGYIEHEEERVASLAEEITLEFDV